MEGNKFEITKCSMLQVFGLYDWYTIKLRTLTVSMQSQSMKRLQDYVEALYNTHARHWMNEGGWFRWK